MREILIFAAGTMLGGFAGVITMCLCQINRINRDTGGKGSIVKISSGHNTENNVKSYHRHLDLLSWTRYNVHDRTFLEVNA